MCVGFRSSMRWMEEGIFGAYSTAISLVVRFLKFTSCRSCSWRNVLRESVCQEGERDDGGHFYRNIYIHICERLIHERA